MATAGTGIADLTSLFIHYRPGFVQTLNNRVLARKLAVGKDYKWEGDYVLKKIQIARHTGISFGSDGMALPPAGKEAFIDSKTYRRFMAATVQVTDGALNTALTSKHACKSTSKSLLTGLAEAIHKFQNFVLTRDGTGKMATVYGYSGGTLTVDDARGLWRDQWYTIRDITGVTIKTSFQVSLVNLSPTGGRATLTVTGVSSSYTYASGDFVVWGMGYWESYGNTTTGLDSLIGTGTLQGITASSYPEWHSLVFSPSSGTQDQSTRLFRQMLAGLYQLGGDEKQNLFALTSVWDMIEFEQLWEGEVRLTPQARIAGLVAPVFHTHFGKVMPYTDSDAPYGKMFFVDRREITRAVQKDLDWRKTGGEILMKSSTNQHYHGDMMEICENMIDNRRRCGKITDLTNTIKVMH
jgi:hypothetical protein